MAAGSALTQNNSSYSEAQSQMALLPNYYRWTYGAFRPFLRGRVVELAAGAGLGLPAYSHQVSEVLAVDHDAELLSVLKRNHPTVRVVQVDLLGDWSALSGLEADAAVMMDVLEHFEDPSAFAAKAGAVLKSGGMALVKVPAQQRLYCEADVASGHYKRYDGPDLVALMEGAGFRTVMMRSINVLGALAYSRRGNRKTNFSKTFSRGQLRAINSIIPIIAAVDRVMPGRGLSLVGAFQKVS